MANGAEPGRRADERVLAPGGGPPAQTPGQERRSERISEPSREIHDKSPKVRKGRVVEDTLGRPARSRTTWQTRSRWLVHLGLLVFAAAALGTLQLLHIRNAIHADVGLVFAGLVVVHLAQRRHRIARMFAQLRHVRPRIERELRLLASDAILAFITLNVVVSGIIDWGRGTPVPLPFPRPFGRWHLLSSVVLIVYLVVHVSRRWKRIRRSTIR